MLGQARSIRAPLACVTITDSVNLSALTDAENEAPTAIGTFSRAATRTNQTQNLRANPCFSGSDAQISAPRASVWVHNNSFFQFFSIFTSEIPSIRRSSSWFFSVHLTEGFPRLRRQTTKHIAA